MLRLTGFSEMVKWEPRHPRIRLPSKLIRSRPGVCKAAGVGRWLCKGWGGRLPSCVALRERKPPPLRLQQTEDRDHASLSSPQGAARRRLRSPACPPPTVPGGWAPNPPLLPDSLPGRARLGAAGSAPAGPAAGTRLWRLQGGRGMSRTGLGGHAGRAWGAGLPGDAPSPRPGLRSRAASARQTGRGGRAHVGRFGVPPSERLVRPERRNQLPRLLQP